MKAFERTTPPSFVGRRRRGEPLEPFREPSFPGSEPCDPGLNGVRAPSSSVVTLHQKRSTEAHREDREGRHREQNRPPVLTDGRGVVVDEHLEIGDHEDSVDERLAGTRMPPGRVGCSILSWLFPCVERVVEEARPTRDGCERCEDPEGVFESE